MEMCLAPILILYYFPAEFSRHLYDNARRRRKFSHLPGQGRILPAFWRCGNAASLHYSPVSTFHHASKPSTPTLSLSLSLFIHCLSNTRRRYRASISFLLLLPPQFSSPHHQSPKQMTRSRRRYPPRHRSSPRLSDIRIFLSMPAPSHTLPHISLFINHAGFTKIANLRSNVRAKRRKT